MSNNTNKVNPIVALLGGFFGFVPKAVAPAVDKGFAAGADALEVGSPVVVAAPTPTPALRPLKGDGTVVSFVLPIKGMGPEEMKGGTGESIALRYGSVRRFTEGGTVKVGGCPVAVDGGSSWAGVGLTGEVILKLADVSVPKEVFRAVAQAAKHAGATAQANPEADRLAPQLVLWVTASAAIDTTVEEAWQPKDGKEARTKGFLNFKADSLVAWEVIFPGDPRWVKFMGDTLPAHATQALLSAPTRAAAAAASINPDEVVAQAMANIDAMLAGRGAPTPKAKKPKGGPKAAKAKKADPKPPVDTGRPPAFDVDYGDDDTN